jgi:UDP-glucuronate decarboxylase
MDNPLITILEIDARRVISAVNLSGLAGKAILLTGASGLIGTYFIACIREESKSQGVPINLLAVINSEPSDHLINLLDFEGACFIQGDLTDLDFVKKLGDFDLVIHAAGYGQPGRFMEDPVKTLKLNTSTTLELFDRLSVNGHFLFISTSEVYSGLDNPPYNEYQIGTTNTTHSRSCYIEAKRCGEAIVNAYRTRGVNASSARLALAYGPGTKPADRRVINSFIERGLIKKNIELQDMGEAKRTYCYVSDAVEILWHILLGGNRPIYNVGGKSKTTIAELAKDVAKYLNVPFKFPTKSNEMSGAPDDVFLDMSLVENDFKKTNYVTFEDGLARTIEWQKALYSKSNSWRI